MAEHERSDSADTQALSDSVAPRAADTEQAVATTRAPLGIMRRSEEELREWLQTEVGFITGLCRYADAPIVLEPFQIAFLRNTSPFRWVTKSRQVGLSFVMALEALARCHLQDNHCAVFISYAQEEAKEKVLLARQVYEDLPLEYQKRLVTDAKTELAFESSGKSKRLSRIVSVPSKAPRGKHGSVYMDEIAHYVADREVYSGSTALVLRAQGQLTGCSTPLGRRGVFWEIATEELRKYPQYARQWVPWWLSSSFSLDARAAAALAASLPTEERVARFGKPPLLQQFDSLPLEDFQQEFECVMPGSLVLTEGGPSPIERIRLGERVLTHRGRYRHVVATHRSAFTGALKVIRTAGPHEPLIVTGNHPVLALRVEPFELVVELEPHFIPAAKLRVGDLLMLPLPEAQDSETAPTPSRVPEGSYAGTRYVYLPIQSIHDLPYDGAVHNLQVSEDESYVVGAYAVHNCSFVDESYSFYPYELLLPCTSDDVALAREPLDVPPPRGRLVAGFDVGRSHDRSELAVFEEEDGRFTCRMLKTYDGVPFAEQEGELRTLLNALPIARLSIDRSGIGMHLTENLARDYASIVGENFTGDAKERWATQLKILLQHRALLLPRDRELVAQFHAIKRRVLPSGKVSFDAERTTRGHADRFWAVALACQKERVTPAARNEISVRVIG
jgi:phage FluMu gp28-like protein